MTNICSNSSQPEARICLDSAHVFTYDPSMRMGIEILHTFGTRFAQVHLSGIQDGSLHVPMTNQHVIE